MATSGSKDSSGYQGRVLRFEWGTNSTNPSTNVRNIWYKVTAVGGSSSIYYHHNETVSINGSNVYTGSSSHAVTTGDVLASDNMDINQSSTLTLTVKMNGGIYVTSDNINTEYSWSLDEIPRYPSANHSLNSKTLNSIVMNWSSDSTIDYLWYSTNNGSSWTGVDVTDGTSGTYTISGLSPNTTYNIKTRLRRKDSQLTADTSTLNVTTYQIGLISSVSNFNHGDSTTLVTTNPSGSALSLAVKISNTQILTKTVSTGSNTISFTDEQLDNIYKLYGSGSSLTVTFVLTTANNSNYTNSKTATITLKGNQKVIRDNVSGTWKRGKLWTNVSGTWKRAVIWTNVNGTWKRGI